MYAPQKKKTEFWKILEKFKPHVDACSALMCQHNLTQSDHAVSEWAMVWHGNLT
jgi:hypothetical protein